MGQSRGNEPTDAELERGILDALKLGMKNAAGVLTSQLEERQRARLPDNVRPIESAKRK